jgi:hypothetical protein
MTGTDDLRDLLTRQAEFDDTALTGRAASVHQRVRTVRRRRRATTAGAAAAVVAVALVGVALPRFADAPGPAAQRELAGMTAPEKLTSLGYGYAFSEGTAGEDRAVIRVPRSEEPRLVSWAVSGDDDRARVDGPTGEEFTSTSGDYADFVYVEPGLDGRMRVSAEGRDVAVAVYTLDELAPGVTADGMTFREQRGGDRLLAAQWAPEGATEMEISFTLPDGVLAAVDWCTAPAGLEVHVEIEGGGATSGDCSESRHFDVQSSKVGYTGGLRDADGTRLRPGDRVTARIWVSERDSGFDEGPVVDGPVPGLRLGLGLYEEQPAVGDPEVGLPPVFEHDGHTYADPTVVEGVGRAETTVDASRGPVLVVTGGRNLGRGRVATLVDGEPVHLTDYGSTLAGSGESTLLHSGTHEVVLRAAPGAVRPGSLLVLATYQRVD